MIAGLVAVLGLQGYSKLLGVFVFSFVLQVPLIYRGLGTIPPPSQD
jgi:hypothetical protein